MLVKRAGHACAAYDGRAMSDASDTANDITASDRTVIAAQIGREPRALEGVAARCVFGFPAVTKQASTDDQGRPFPTAYYVTCPHMVRQIDRLESDGGVRRFESELASNEALRVATDAAHAEHRQLHGSAIAGSGDTMRVKCLHAHAGFALAGHEHPLGEAVLREAAPLWCTTARCASCAGD
jgi:hypothetical protein